MMNLGTLIRRSWGFYWRTHLAVVLGVMIAGAVLVGALVIGDSLRASLRDLTLQRLDKIEEVLISPRFFRTKLAEEITATPKFNDHFKAAQPAILLRASMEFNRESNDAVSSKTMTHRSGQVQVLGVQKNIWQTWEETTHRQTNIPPAGDILVPAFLSTNGQRTEFVAPKLNEVVINKTLADELAITPGMLVDKNQDGKPLEIEIVMRLPRPSEIPADSPLGRKNETTRSRALRVIGILPNEGFGRFGLLPTQQLVKNAFVDIETLQDMLEQPEKANAILAISFDKELRIINRSDEPSTPALRREYLEQHFHPTLTDFGLKLDQNDRGFWQITSDSMLIEPKIADALKQRISAATPSTSKDISHSSSHAIQSSFIYLSNWIASEDEKAKVPYSTIAAMDFTDANPFGPWLDVDGKVIEKLADDEIVLNRWTLDDFKKQGTELKSGDSIKLTFFEPESTHGEVKEQSATFKLRAIVPMNGISLDKDLTPELKGVTDKDSLANWNPPFDYDAKRVRTVKPHDEDEQYWHDYKTSPKAFISAAAGRKLWKSRFGEITAIRFTAHEGDNRQEIEKWLLSGLKPAEFGLVWQPVKMQGLRASAGTTPFDFLFLGFSMFLIVSALLLVSLLFKLGLDRRARELGIELAVGFSIARLRRLAMGEAAGVAFIGAVLGIVMGVGYAALMIHGLRTWWVAAVVTPFIQLHISTTTLAIGLIVTWLVAMLTIAWTLRQLRRSETKQLLSGDLAESITRKTRSRHWLDWLRVVAIVLAIVLIGIGTQFSGEAQAGAFFGSGMLLLFAVLSGLHKHLKTTGFHVEKPLSGIGTLAWSNTKRSPTRSTLAIGLIAAAVYMIVSISAFRLQPPPTGNDPTQGDGGFALLGETDVPIYRDLQNPKVKEDYAELISTANQDSDQQNRDAMVDSNPISFRTSGGDDASCLNLYRPRRPRGWHQ